MRLTAFVLCFVASAAAQPNAATEALARLQQKTASLPAEPALDFRMLAAQSLQKTQPEVASRLVQQGLDELRRLNTLRPGSVAVRVLASLAPREAAAVIPPENRASLVGALLNARRIAEAAALFRELLPKGMAPMAVAGRLLGDLARENPEDAKKLFGEIAATVDPNTAAPIDAWRLTEAANAIAPIAPSAAAAAAEAIVKAASNPDYGKGAAIAVAATFGVARPTVTAADTREAILIAAGAVLARTAPDRSAAFKDVLGKWGDLAPLRVLSASWRAPGQTPPAPNPALFAISKRLAPYRSLPTDADRARLALDVVAEIEKLQPIEQLGPARALSHLITEGDMGKTALTAVTRVYGKSMLSHQAASVDDWIHLAKLIRYERVPSPISEPTLDAALALLDVREAILQDASFTLSGLDGKAYSLAGLGGKVVLVNFWATWCPPCRKEMPDMEKLYREFRPKGFIVLAISDEDRATVDGFLKKQNYTFPVLLDPDRKVHTAFDVEGIPKSFLFDRNGKLAAQTIDMRTESQFREMLKRAGLE